MILISRTTNQYNQEWSLYEKRDKRGDYRIICIDLDVGKTLPAITFCRNIEQGKNTLNRLASTSTLN